MAEITVIDDATNAEGIRECWKQRLQSLKRELRSADASILEHLLIQQTAFVLAKVESHRTQLCDSDEALHYATLGIYWEKRLSAAEKRFSVVKLARVRRLSRNTPALQVNIAAEGGQQAECSQVDCWVIGEINETDPYPTS